MFASPPCCAQCTNNETIRSEKRLASPSLNQAPSLTTIVKTIIKEKYEELFVNLWQI